MPAPRLRRITFRFAIDQAVRLGGMLGTVTACDHTFAGREIYNVIFDCPDRPLRTVLGDYLAPDRAPESRHRRSALGRSTRVWPRLELQAA